MTEQKKVTTDYKPHSTLVRVSKETKAGLEKLGKEMGLTMPWVLHVIVLSHILKNEGVEAAMRHCKHQQMVGGVMVCTKTGFKLHRGIEA